MTNADKPKTNKDKYLKDGVDVGEFICGLRDYLDSHRDNYDTSNLINNYLNKTVKPTLTEDEKVILRNIFNGFDKIRRTSIQDGRHLEVYCIFNKIWYEFMYQHLFQFIQPGEEYKISDLLEE